MRLGPPWDKIIRPSPHTLTGTEARLVLRLSVTMRERLQEDDSHDVNFLMSLDVSVSKEIISSFDEMPPSVRERKGEIRKAREVREERVDAGKQEYGVFT